MRSDEADGAEVRTLGPEDLRAHRALMNQAFSGGTVVPDDATFGEGAEKNVHGVYVGGELVAALGIRPYQAHWGENVVLPLGGIAGVATRPEARGKGYVDALLRHSLRVMKDAGQVVSALYPFAWAFYRRYGWDFVGEKRIVTLPLSEIKSAPEGANVHALPTDNADALERELSPVYTVFARRYRGVFTTGTHGWQGTLRHNNSKTTYAYIYKEPGKDVADGYLLWRYGDKGGEIRQFIANTPAAWRGLLSLLHYFGTQVDEAKATLPGDAPLWSHLMHWRLSVKTEPVFMGRVVDVAGALASLSVAPNAPDAVILQITDEHAPWNNGQFGISSEGGKVEMRPIRDAGVQPDVACDIQAFSQAFWGQPSLTELRRAGRVTVSSKETAEEGFAYLASLLPAAPVFTLDDF
jgi:predicted acetyltransferase